MTFFKFFQRTAKKNTVQWGADVYPAIRSQFDDFRKFGEDFTKSYDKISPKLSTLKSQQVDDVYIEEELGYLREECEDDGYSLSQCERKLKVSKARTDYLLCGCKERVPCSDLYLQSRLKEGGKKKFGS